MDFTTILATIMMCGMFTWNIFLIYDVRQRPDPPTLLSSLRLLAHSIPAMILLGTCIMAQNAQDSALVWFAALFAFRYWRILVNVFFWFRYNPALATGRETITSSDCTVIVPTVGPNGNSVFADMVAAILANGPGRLIFSTNTEDAAQQVRAILAKIVSDLKAGTSSYQQLWGVGAVDVTTDIQVTNAKVSNKRHQVVKAFEMAETKILVMVDDTAIWHPRFLLATLPAFANEKVGFVGTRKWVKRLSYVADPNVGYLTNLWMQYWSGFWNVMGGLYLARHNFEIRATNAADGGVFCVSGRSSLIRTSIVNNNEFKQGFLNEYVLRFGDRFPGWGPVTADDDNFITRHVINNGWDIKIQYSEEATMTTVLGKLPLKFPDQCLRWSRTTFRQNPIALFADRTIWWKWPLTVWTTYFPWMYNAALFWDGVAVLILTQTKAYAESRHRLAVLGSFIVFIWATKLIKTAAWFWEHPMDFVLYFLIPAYPAFAYYHSLLKIWTAFTFWDLAWSGRKLPKVE
ncbi:glycosyltransferase family 2 protein [Cucurbitaria berberidis CBS 394.84]|uniref:Glycosyltransferase family 2 protein n=1 Tax=Cucurbitaria berberidis CBS 394.84 TaxID=1168544 RepID=A0A9P4GBJ8_9PLEO|nr:glycosyltransferase family 2 protein [Cucurbitaria berberidis CBS 394.84]KAF1842366.1 glycosyltransferase family 2 protein [Cucurbitaria berberidis CBS 394.84]